MRFHHISEDQPVQPRWAVGAHTDKAIGWARSQLKRPSTVLVWVNIKDLFRYTTRGFELDLSDPTGGENAIGKRITRAKQHWLNNGWMNPSDIHVHENGTVDWTDGRHRVVAAYQMGSRWAPVIMDRESFENLQQTNIRYKKHINEVSLSDKGEYKQKELGSPVGEKVYTINGVDVYQTNTPGHDSEISLVIENKVIGYMELLHIKNNYYDISHVYVDPKHSRQGYGYLLYIIAILKKDFVIVSRFVLTQYSQSIWRRMIQDPRITVYGVDQYSPEQDIVPIFVEGNTISTISDVNMNEVMLIARSTRTLPDEVGQELIYSQTTA